MARLDDSKPQPSSSHFSQNILLFVFFLLVPISSLFFRPLFLFLYITKPDIQDTKKKKTKQKKTKKNKQKKQKNETKQRKIDCLFFWFVLFLLHPRLLRKRNFASFNKPTKKLARMKTKVDNCPHEMRVIKSLK